MALTAGLGPAKAPEQALTGRLPAVAVLVVWYASGVGYVASILMAPQNAMTAAVATVMIMGGFLNGVQPRYVSLSPFMKRAVGVPPAGLLGGVII